MQPPCLRLRGESLTLTHIVVSALCLRLPGLTERPASAAAMISSADSSKTMRAMAPSASWSSGRRFSVTRAKWASAAENRLREAATDRHSQ